MGMKAIMTSRNTLVDHFVYEGERIGVAVSKERIDEIPGPRIHECLIDASLPNGEACKILQQYTPMSRLPIVVME